MSNSLMRKTKQDLIDIILRKDDVHKSLNDSIDVLQKDLNDKTKLYDDAKEQVKQLNKKVTDLNALLALNRGRICNLEDINKSLNKDIEDAIIKTNDLTEACDEYASRIQEYIEDTKYYKRLSILTSGVTIIVLLVLLLSL